MNVNGQQEEVNSMVNEAVIKLVNGVEGIEELFGISLDDFEWSVQRNGKAYQIYFEKLKGGNNENKN